MSAAMISEITAKAVRAVEDIKAAEREAIWQYVEAQPVPLDVQAFAEWLDARDRREPAP